jgi:formylglycine-generating enzyme required for sulfatase activity
MAGNIFINYRRDDSISTAGRLHDRLAQAFGRKNLFMDVDHIPAGVDFVDYLPSQVAACDVFLAVIGPNWLDAKDDEGRRRLDNPDDFVAIEIAAALARNIRVIPVLVDGARIPKIDKLPESIKPLVRRNAVEVRNTNFGRDAEALVDKVREALKSRRPVTGQWPFVTRAAAWLVALGAWRTTALSATALLLLLLAGWIGLYQMGGPVWLPWAHPDGSQAKLPSEAASLKSREERERADAEAKRNAEERVLAESAARPDPALAVEPGSGRSFRDRLIDGQPCPACPEMVVVPAGAFTMGSPENERGHSSEESPEHRVTIANPLAIGKFSVTRGEFAAFVKETDYKSAGGCDVWSGSEWTYQSEGSWRSPRFDQDDRHPLVCVNWYDAKAFVAWLSKKVGKTYRLLTEAEREYATRAKTFTRYSFGDDEAALSEYAWYRANSGDATHPVGEKKSNAFGLFDMHGNAWAWCEDTWQSSYHDAPNDGSAWQNGDTSSRVVRGGSWYRPAAGLRSAFRYRLAPDGRYTDVSFRVARGLSPP